MTLRPPIVDLRSRPSWLHKFFGSTPNTPEFDTVRWLNKRVGTSAGNIDHFTRSNDIESFTGEMDAAGISVGVMVARNTPTVRVSNDDVAEAARQSAGRLIGVASVDPQELGIRAALDEAERAVRTLGCHGLNIDAAFYKTPLAADAPQLLPLYEACLALGVPGVRADRPDHTRPAAQRSLRHRSLGGDVPETADRRLPRLLSARRCHGRRRVSPRKRVRLPRHVHVFARREALHRSGQRVHARPIFVRFVLSVPPDGAGGRRSPGVRVEARARWRRSPTRMRAVS